MGLLLTGLFIAGGAALAHALKKDKKVETEAKDSIAHSSNAFSKLEKKVKKSVEELETTRKTVEDSFKVFADTIEKIKNRPQFKEYKKNDVKIPAMTDMYIEEVSNMSYAIAAVIPFMVFTLGNKIEELYHESMIASLKYDIVSSKLNELNILAARFTDSLVTVFNLYQEYQNQLSHIVDNEGKTDFELFNDDEILILQNTVLLVGLLYNMCKVTLTETTDDGFDFSIHKSDIQKSISDSQKVLAEISPDNNDNGSEAVYEEETSDSYSGITEYRTHLRIGEGISEQCADVVNTDRYIDVGDYLIITNRTNTYGHMGINENKPQRVDKITAEIREIPLPPDIASWNHISFIQLNHNYLLVICREKDFSLYNDKEDILFFLNTETLEYRKAELEYFDYFNTEESVFCRDDRIYYRTEEKGEYGSLYHGIAVYDMKTNQCTRLDLKPDPSDIDENEVFHPDGTIDGGFWVVKDSIIYKDDLTMRRYDLKTKKTITLASFEFCDDRLDMFSKNYHNDHNAIDRRYETDDRIYRIVLTQQFKGGKLDCNHDSGCDIYSVNLNDPQTINHNKKTISDVYFIGVKDNYYYYVDMTGRGKIYKDNIEKSEKRIVVDYSNFFTGYADGILGKKIKKWVQSFNIVGDYMYVITERGYDGARVNVTWKIDLKEKKPYIAILENEEIKKHIMEFDQELKKELDSDYSEDDPDEEEQPEMMEQGGPEEEQSEALTQKNPEEKEQLTSLRPMGLVSAASVALAQMRPEKDEQRRAEEQKRLEEEQRRALEQKRLEEEEQLNALRQKRLEEEEHLRVLAQRRLEEEEQRRAEEQKRLEEEQRRASEYSIIRENGSVTEKTRSIIPAFGAAAEQSPEIFQALSDNALYLSATEMKFSNHQELTVFVFNYINQNFKSVTTNLYPSSSERFYKKLKNLQSVYGYNVVTSDNVLFYFDNTVFGSAKDGFVLTSDNFCFRSALADKGVIPIESIQKISISNKNLYINDRSVAVTLCYLPEKALRDIMVYCICHILLIKKNLQVNSSSHPYFSQQHLPQQAVSRQYPVQQIQPLQQPMYQAMPQNTQNPQNYYPTTPPSSNWKCICGSVFDDSFLFCPRCGTKRPQIQNEWVCPSCGRKNSIQFLFCGTCGTKNPQ